MSIVADFEADYWSAGWEIPGRQRDDWGDEGEWRVIQLHPAGMGASDWWGWDALQFDARVIGEEGVGCMCSAAASRSPGLA